MYKQDEMSRSGSLETSAESKICGFFLLFLLAYILIGQASAWLQGFAPFGLDFSELYRAGERLNKGLPLYSNVDLLGQPCQPYVLPPPLGILSRPLALLDFHRATMVWFGIMVASIFGSVAIFARSLKPPASFVLSAVMLVTVFRSWPATMEFSLANCTFLVLFFTCCVYNSVSSRRWISAALWIVAAALIKTWAIGLVGCLVIHRQWKAAAICLGTWLASMAALFTLIGWKEFSGFLKMSSQFAGSVDDIKPAQSVIGFARLHFSTNHYVAPIVDSKVAMVAVILSGAALIAAGLIYGLLHQAKTAHEQRLQVGLIIVSMLLSMPFCDVEYLLCCTPVLWTLLSPSEEVDRTTARIGILSAIVLYLAEIRVSHSTNWSNYCGGLKSLLVSDAFFWLCGLWLVLVISLVRLNARKKAATETAAAADQNLVAQLSGAAR